MREESRLEWQYQPADCFEEPFSFEMDEGRIEVADGRAIARLPATACDQNEHIRDGIHRELENRFLGAQLINHKPYELSGTRLYRKNARGKEDVVIFMKALMSAVTVTG